MTKRPPLSEPLNPEQLAASDRRVRADVEAYRQALRDIRNSADPDAQYEAYLRAIALSDKEASITVMWGHDMPRWKSPDAAPVSKDEFRQWAGERAKTWAEEAERRANPAPTEPYDQGNVGFFQAADVRRALQEDDQAQAAAYPQPPVVIKEQEKPAQQGWRGWLKKIFGD